MNLTEQWKRIEPVLAEHRTHFIVFMLAFIAGIGYYIRTRNVSLLVDATTGGYWPSDPDALGLLRYVEYVIEHGSLMNIDYMRYFPTGFGAIQGTSTNEFSLLAHLLAYFYEFLHFFNSAVTVQYADVIYPAAAFVVALFFFYILVRKVFDWKVALLASAFLTVMPAYLYRTLSGVSDKEAMAMIFFYLTLYLFLRFILSEKLSLRLVYAFLAGVVVGLLLLLWGGYVFVFLTIGSFFLLLIILDRVDLTMLVSYGLFFAVPLVIVSIFYPERAGFYSFALSLGGGALFFPLLFGIVHYLLVTKNIFKIRDKFSVPPFIVTLGAVFVLGVLLFSIYYSPGALIDKAFSFLHQVTSPLAQSRWSITVVENMQPYFKDIITLFGVLSLSLASIGAILLFSGIVKSFLSRWMLTSLYAFSLFGILFSRYSSAGILNGENFFSQALFFGSILLLLSVILYDLVVLYRKNREDYQRVISSISLSHLFILVLLFFMLLAGRSAYRFGIIIAPMVAILVAYCLFVFVGFARKQANIYLSYGVPIAVFILATFLLHTSFTVTLSQASSAGTPYDQGWQYAMDWVRGNTPEDAVFASWWDYGYYIQTVGQRATISDGGNAHPAINYLFARHVFLANDDVEAAEMLEAKNATHLLISDMEVGKYGAYSSIGSDANYDKFSWILQYTLDVTNSQENRNGTTLLYTGASALDEDFVYNGVLYPGTNAGISTFSLPVTLDDNGTITSFSQPSAYFYYLGNFQQVPVTCVFYHGEKILFNESGYDACLYILPTYDGQYMKDFGSLLYLSPRVKDTLMARLYLLGEESPYFTLAYTDQGTRAFFSYNGRFIGPYKIWKVTYPEGVEIPEEYYGTTIPEGVTEITANKVAY